MRASMGKRILLIGCLLAGLLSSSGCASYHVVFEREQRQFLSGPITNSPQLSCNGDLRVERDHGLLLWPGGFYRNTDYYHIYFITGTEFPKDFYFTQRRYYEYPKLLEARGAVMIDGREVLIAVEYRDERGAWRKPPINGHHKIDRVFPDDRVRAVDTAQ
jgi:hypothetical protein